MVFCAEFLVTIRFLATGAPPKVVVVTKNLDFTKNQSGGPYPPLRPTPAGRPPPAAPGRSAATGLQQTPRPPAPAAPSGSPGLASRPRSIDRQPLKPAPGHSARDLGEPWAAQDQLGHRPSRW
jgi:hypothetical protein